MNSDHSELKLRFHRIFTALIVAAALAGLGRTARAEELSHAASPADQAPGPGRTDEGDRTPPAAKIDPLPPAPRPRLVIPAFEGDIDEEAALFKGGERLGDKALAEGLARALARPELEGVKVGLHVVNAATGEVLVNVNGRERFNPASNMKLFTTAAALVRLGPDFRFKTRILAENDIGPDGTLEGDLVICGGGDPWLVVEQVYRLASELYALGLRRIEGNIIIDDSYFDTVREGPGWEQDSSDSAYQAPMGALSVNFNAISVYVSPTEPGMPASVTVLPQTRYIKIDNRAVTSGGRRTRLIVTSPREKDRNKVLVKGRIHPEAHRWVTHLKIDNPPLFAGWTIHDAMKQIGIKTTGVVRIMKAPAKARPLHTFSSLPLGFLASLVNKYSNNHMAEQTLKTLGAEAKGPPGTWEKGIEMMRAFIADELKYPPITYVAGNGSGLGDVNQVTPEMLTRVLVYMSREPRAGPEFVASLAVAGRDGTMMTSAYKDCAMAGLLRGKTGTLAQVTALSGYLATRGGRTLAVSLILNNCKGRDSRRLQAIQREVMLLLFNYEPGLKSGEHTQPNEEEKK